MGYKVIIEEFTESGVAYNEYQVEADSYRFREAGDNHVFVEFANSLERIIDVFDASDVHRIKRTDG